MADIFDRLVPIGGAIVGGMIGGPAGAMIGGSIGSAISQGNAAEEASQQYTSAANRAAELQRESAREALALQQRMYEEGVARQQPYYQTGVNALAALRQRTGLPASVEEAPRRTGGKLFGPIGRVVAGMQAPSAASAGTGVSSIPAAFQYRPDQLTQDPGYQFRLSEGLKALERSAAARGGLMSGATGKALTRYGQEAASQEYQSAYNRALTEYNASRAREAEEYNRLAGLAGVGGTTAQQIGAAGQSYGTQAGNLLTGTATNIGNLGMQSADVAGQAALARGSAYGRTAGDISYLTGRYLSPQSVNALTPAFSQTYLGGSGFGTGLAYGNQDIGQFL